MKHKREFTESGQAYAAAFAAYDTAHDLPLTLLLYRNLLASHPDAQEADCSLMQVQNTVDAVAPKQELIDARLELALARFEQDRPLDVGRTTSPHVVAKELG